MPQGSVLSPILFCIMINDILSTTPVPGILNTHCTLTTVRYGTLRLTVSSRRGGFRNFFFKILKMLNNIVISYFKPRALLSSAPCHCSAARWSPSPTLVLPQSRFYLRSCCTVYLNSLLATLLYSTVYLHHDRKA